jgi:hypothetical protein
MGDSSTFAPSPLSLTNDLGSVNGDDDTDAAEDDDNDDDDDDLRTTPK